MATALPGYISPAMPIPLDGYASSATTHSSSTQLPPLSSEGKGCGSAEGGDQKRHRYQHIQPQSQLLCDDSFLPRTEASDDLSSLFEFDLPLPSTETKRPKFAKERSLGRSDGWDPLCLQPLSPPQSAAYSEGNWRPFEQQQQFPHNILTRIDPSRARTQYGQTTPPDDEQFSSLESELMMQEQDDIAFADDPSTTSHKQTSKTPQASSAPPKRVRKNGGRAPKDAVLDPNNPENVRRSKFLERNRVAASKCRQKKKEWTNNLEARARGLQKDNASLRQLLDSCKEEILFLKGEILKHANCGCSEVHNYLQRSAQTFNGVPDAEFKQESSPVYSVAPTRIGSPSDHAHPRPMGYQRDKSRAFSEELERSRRSSVSDQNLELLLTSHFFHDTSEEGIAKRVR